MIGQATARRAYATWNRRAHPDTLRLYCFPHAGGTASSYLSWRGRLGERVEVCPIHLPGRERRYTEPPFRRIGALVAELRAELPRDRPFVLFGHSLGALVAFEFARLLRSSGDRAPEALVLSGCPAPHLIDRSRLRSQWPDEALMEDLRAMRGTSETLLADPDFRRMLLLPIRADYEMVESWAFVPDELLHCPLFIVGGDEDDEVPTEELGAWQEYTDGESKLTVFAGGHFYLVDRQEALLTQLSEFLGAIAPEA